MKKCIMEYLKYPGAEWHKQHHAECLQRCLQLKRDCHEGRDATIETASAVFSEIIHLIAEADLKFKEFLDGKGLVKHSARTR